MPVEVNDMPQDRLHIPGRRPTWGAALLLLVGFAATPTPCWADDAINLTNAPEEDAFPAWSPDSSRIAITRGDFQNYQIYFQPLDGTDATRVIASSGAREPAWSPDGTVLVWSRLEVLWRAATGDGGIDQIQVTSPSDGGAKDEAPAYSPTADRIAFHTTFTGDSQSSIATIPARGPAVVTRITTEPGDHKRPTWSPNAEEIAFSSGEPGSWNIQIVASKGGEPRDLVIWEASNLHPAWSPDGE